MTCKKHVVTKSNFFLAVLRLALGTLPLKAWPALKCNNILRSLLTVPIASTSAKQSGQTDFNFKSFLITITTSYKLFKKLCDLVLLSMEHNLWKILIIKIHNVAERKSRMYIFSITLGDTTTTKIFTKWCDVWGELENSPSRRKEAGLVCANNWGSWLVSAWRLFMSEKA
jgi:hypothetical protein